VFREERNEPLALARNDRGVRLRRRGEARRRALSLGAVSARPGRARLLRRDRNHSKEVGEAEPAQHRGERLIEERREHGAILVLDQRLAQRGEAAARRREERRRGDGVAHALGPNVRHQRVKHEG